MIFDKLRNIDRSWLYAGFLLVTLFPLVFPIPLPVTVSSTTQQVSDVIESLKPGDAVLLSVEFAAVMSAELYPGLEAVYKHIVSKPGVKVVMIATTTDGPMFVQRLLDTIDAGDKQYGTDIVNLGYLPGGESAIAALCQDVHKTFPRDYYGTDIKSLPAMADLRSASDFALIINDSSGGLGPVGWIRQAHTNYGTTVATILGQDMALSALPYINSRQLSGLVAGLRGAAEYEKLLDTVGSGTAGMGAQSFAAIYFLVLLVVANIGFLGQSWAQKKHAGGGNK
ncbi:MAG: hypothetical protein WBK90_02645 [Bacillota bacterium]